MDNAYKAQVKKVLELNVEILRKVADNILEYEAGNLSKEKLIKHLEFLKEVPNSVMKFID